MRTHKPKKPAIFGATMPDTPPFEDFKLNRQLLNAVTDAGYDTPTAIQRQAIPQILAGHDVLGMAQTGTGKTAAYLLPLLMKLKYAQGRHPDRRKCGRIFKIHRPEARGRFWRDRA
jgi:superfamily II DNA/RNA helicase